MARCGVGCEVCCSQAAHRPTLRVMLASVSISHTASCAPHRQFAGASAARAKTSSAQVANTEEEEEEEDGGGGGGGGEDDGNEEEGDAEHGEQFDISNCLVGTKLKQITMGNGSKCCAGP
ncbi:MAG: hypothetical protein SGPRY_005771 [Prymnesium sp.]